MSRSYLHIVCLLDATYFELCCDNLLFNFVYVHIYICMYTQRGYNSYVVKINYIQPVCPLKLTIHVNVLKAPVMPVCQYWCTYVLLWDIKQFYSMAKNLLSTKLWIHALEFVANPPLLLFMNLTAILKSHNNPCIFGIMQGIKWCLNFLIGQSMGKIWPFVFVLQILCEDINKSDLAYYVWVEGNTIRAGGLQGSREEDILSRLLWLHQTWLPFRGSPGTVIG